MEEVTVISQVELEDTDGTPDVSRQVAFEDEDVLMIQSRVAGGVTTGWHHNGNGASTGTLSEDTRYLNTGQEGTCQWTWTLATSSTFRPGPFGEW